MKIKSLKAPPAEIFDSHSIPGEVILLLPGHPEGGGQSVGGVSHGLVGGELGDGGQLRSQEVWPDLGEEVHLGPECLGLGRGHHQVPHLPRVTDGHVRHELDTPSDADIVNS